MDSANFTSPHTDADSPPRVDPELYFDHGATTPLHPRVRDAMLPWLGGAWGNTSSAHRAGRQALAAVEMARAQVARLLHGRPEEVLFTASGTEANNTVIFDRFSPWDANTSGTGHLVVSTLEHPSVTAAAARLETAGVEVSRVTPGSDGVVAAETMIEALRPDTRLVCLMLANNEIGTLQPVRELAAACRDRGVPLLCDAVQAVGKIEVDVADLGVDYLVLGAHKFYGPLGAAALWTRTGADVPTPYLVGGGQEGGRRASTVNVAATAGLGEAAALAREELPGRTKKLAALRDGFESALEPLSPFAVHAQDVPRLPNISNVAFLGRPGFDVMSGFDVMNALDELGVCISTGSACHSGTPQPSATLRQMGIDEAQALASMRISFGHGNTEASVQQLVDLLRQVLGR